MFLDYDGTLADFAPTPEDVEPDPTTIALLAGLARCPYIRAAVISGRRLAQVKTLVPVPGVLLAGTYGVELQMPDGSRIDRMALAEVRPALAVLKPRWLQLVAGREGFFLEDKQWALALHARFAADWEAERVLSEARQLAEELAEPAQFRIADGDRFLEVGPMLAHKGRTVAYILDHHPWPGAVPLYLGDDERDEEAFGVVKERRGLAIVVSPQPRQTAADCRLESPQAAHRWLEGLPARLGQGG